LKNKSDNENPFFSFINSLYSIGFEGGNFIAYSLFGDVFATVKYKQKAESMLKDDSDDFGLKVLQQ
jgi:hypothetical protein